MQTSALRLALFITVLALTCGLASRSLTAVAPGFSPARGATQESGKRGILLLAHGGKPEWNERVTALASRVAQDVPIEVAFGMASRPNIQSAVDRLVSGGVTEIVAIPLFVSSHSSVVTSTEYLLGAREDMPPELKIFAKMNHSAPGAAHATNSHADHAAMADPTSPVKSSARIRVTTALDSHQLVGDILASRALALSRTPTQEAVVLVAHGPVSDAENKLWLDDMSVLAARVRAAAPFASVDSLTVRDDAPKPIRDAATEEFRALVTRRTSEQRRVLIVPLLLSYGGIEEGIKKRLDGLDVAMADRALMPDDRLVEWVLAMATARR